MQTGHGRKADIWSVGCTVLQMVTGQPPWKALNLGTPAALMFHIANTPGPPPLPDTLSDELRSFLLCCFEREPAKRAGAAELLRHAFLGDGYAASLAPPSGAGALGAIGAIGGGASARELAPRPAIEAAADAAMARGSRASRYREADAGAARRRA